MSIREEVHQLLTKLARQARVPIVGLDQEAVKAALKSGYLPLQSEVQEWLCICNGANIPPGGVFGIRPSTPALDISTIQGLHTAWHVNSWTPVASDGCGNFYMLTSRDDVGPGHPVVFVDTMSDVSRPLFVAASDLWHFLRFLFSHELGDHGWPFDKSKVIALDRAILNCTGATLPWEV